MGANSGSSRDDYYANQQAAQDYAAGQAAKDPAATDPYGQAGVSSQSLRQRGDTKQKRVGLDTRVRGDSTSGTAGAAGKGTSGVMGEAMGVKREAPEQQAPAEIPQNQSWQAQRQPVDLASVRQRVLSFVQGYGQQGGQ